MAVNPGKSHSRLWYFGTWLRFPLTTGHASVCDMHDSILICFKLITSPAATRSAFSQFNQTILWLMELDWYHSQTMWHLKVSSRVQRPEGCIQTFDLPNTNSNGLSITVWHWLKVIYYTVSILRLCCDAVYESLKESTCASSDKSDKYPKPDATHRRAPWFRASCTGFLACASIGKFRCWYMSHC